MRFLFRTLLFTLPEDDDFEHSAQEQEEWRTTTIGFKFHRGLKSSVITFQAVVATTYNKSDRQSSTTTDRDSINDYPITRVNPRSMMTKHVSSSSSRTPSQLGL
jgi:hypothetical protein